MLPTRCWRDTVPYAQFPSFHYPMRRGCDQIMRVVFTLLGIFPDITDRISSITVGQ